ncbi:stage III sporulation protein AH [Geomicrobium sp. JCM 19039]|nr:stage III sporulation protein AH [Geomicrobium sp. JCM 19039]
MVLKKQTVWLLTMLSLVAVLGVYFFGPDSPTTQEAALINDHESLEDFEGELWEQYLEENPDQAVVVEEWNGEVEGSDEEDPEAGDGEENEETDSVDVAAGLSGSETFSALRIEREELRSEAREENTNTIASSDASAEEKNEAHEQNEQLKTLTESESTLEQRIASQGYEDVLVMTDNDEVRIFVKTEELSKTEVVEINRIAHEQIGNRAVAVSYHIDE